MYGSLLTEEIQVCSMAVVITTGRIVTYSLKISVAAAGVKISY
jgi:hypothetical protein